MKSATGALLLALVSTTAWAQVNGGDHKPEASAPFNMTTVATFTLPWRMAFLPDGRMLITEKVGPVWLVTQQGEKTLIGNTPSVYWQNQNGMLGVFVSPRYATDQSIYLTYVEPGDYGGGLALGRARKRRTAGVSDRAARRRPRVRTGGGPERSRQIRQARTDEQNFRFQSSHSTCPRTTRVDARRDPARTTG